MSNLFEQFKLIARCIASSNNEEHLDTCRRMIEERIESKGDKARATLLRKMIRERNGELIIQAYLVGAR